MPRPPATDPAIYARLLAEDLATLPPRITRALQVMADARSPLRAGSYETGNTGTHGPNPGQTALAAQADTDLRQFFRHLKEIDAQLRGLRTKVFDWAPQPLKGKLDFWCQNHLAHGHQEPCASDRSTNCRWCMDVHRKWNAWPTRKLIDLHDRGHRITETEYRRLLGKAPAA